MPPDLWGDGALEVREPTAHTNPALTALRGLPARERVTALAGALRVAPDDELGALAVELLEIGIAEGVDLPPWLRRLAPAGASRPADEALRVLAAHWARLDEPTRQAALAVGVARWERIASNITRDGSPDEALNLAELIIDAPDPLLAASAAALVQSPEPKVALAGERALIRLALVALEDVEPELLGGELGKLAARPRLDRAPGQLAHGAGAERLVRAVADSAWSFAEHRCSGPLLAALLLLDQPLMCDSDRAAEETRASMARLHRLLDESTHPSHAAVGTVLRRREAPILRQRAWRLLTSPGLTAAAAERVARATTTIEHQTVLAEAHLALNPKRARACRLIDARTKREPSANGTLVRLDPTGPIPTEVDVPALSVEERRGLVAYIGVVRADETTRRLARAPMLSDPDAHVRLRLAASADPIELVDLCFDADAGVARHAAYRWSLAGDPGGVRWPPRMREAGRARLASLMACSPHEAVRRVGDTDLARLSPFSPASPAGRLAARRWLAEEPEGFTAQLAERLERGTIQDRVDALRQVRLLRAGDRFLDLVLARLNDPSEDDRVRATAVAALAEAKSEAARHAVEAALSDRDDRVRANAVESRGRQSHDEGDLATSSPEFYGALIELKDDGRHRVRANALRVLLGSGTLRRERVFEPAAVDALESMLADARAEHRVAGVWLAERAMSGAGQARLGTRWAELAKRVSRIAGEDPSQDARRRAARCAARLLGEIRARRGGALAFAEGRTP
ncbi:MAG: HEAT repeat domain-containing protein [Phycisphaerales bacterium]